MIGILGIDIGTTHIKVGVFTRKGELLKLAIRKNIIIKNSQGYKYYHPEKLWNTVASGIRDVTNEQPSEIKSIGITSMAESGLLLNQLTGEYQSHIIPWFDQRTEEIAENLAGEIDVIEHFKKTGLHPSYKQGLAKILWIQKYESTITKDSVWLSTADFIAYKLTGKTGTDYSLAARTYAYRIDKKEWDLPFIRYFGLNESIFPEARRSGHKIGETNLSDCEKIGLMKGIPVAVSGHDHVCAALAVGVINTGEISNSIGTAETLLGSLDEMKLGKTEFDSGFNFGCHVFPSRFFWMGSIQSSGGSVEWFRKQFAKKQLTYQELEELMQDVKNVPTGIFYYPYLAGSGAPRPNPHAKGSFIGLQTEHTRGDILRAIYEGTAYELTRLKRSVDELFNLDIRELITVGGGAKNQIWMQIKADVTNCQLSIPSVTEASLLGAALIAGLGCGVYETKQELLQIVSQINKNVEHIYPDGENHLKFHELFQNGYLVFRESLMNYFTRNQ